MGKPARSPAPAFAFHRDQSRCRYVIAESCSILLFGHHAAVIGINQQINVLALLILGIRLP